MKKSIMVLSIAMAVYGCKNCPANESDRSDSTSINSKREIPEGASQNTEYNYNSISPEAENGPAEGQQGPHGTNTWFFNGKSRD